MIVPRVTDFAVLRCDWERAEQGRPERWHHDWEQWRMPGGAAVRRVAARSGRKVLTVSGKSIANFAETQRSRRRAS